MLPLRHMKKTAVVIGNWKLNPNTVKDAVTLTAGVTKKFKKHEGVTVAVAPSYLHIAEVAKKIGKQSILLAAQDVAIEAMGPFTGEVSAMQLRDMKVTYVIIGHSERRAMGETDEAIQKKIQVALKSNLIPVVCFGEKVRDTQGDFFTFVERQIKSIASVLKAVEIKKVILAYEPIWAISTTKNAHVATPADAKEMQIFVESILTKFYDRPTARAVRVLYGGSVNPTNIGGFVAEGGMDGFLVGGASLKADDFIQIVNATKS